jgi:hypothetical protein
VVDRLDGDPGSSRWLDRLRSVRTRIVASVVLLTALALAGAGLAA